MSQHKGSELNIHNWVNLVYTNDSEEIMREKTERDRPRDREKERRYMIVNIFPVRILWL